MTDTRRSVPEWQGKTPDSKVPARVRLRIFERFGAVCALTGRKIQPGEAWDLDHIIPLALGGEHRESNLQPALKPAHREKTRDDVRAKAKADRLRKSHVGIQKNTRAVIPGSKGSRFKKRLDGTVIDRRTGKPA